MDRRAVKLAPFSVFPSSLDSGSRLQHLINVEMKDVAIYAVLRRFRPIDHAHP